MSRHRRSDANWPLERSCLVVVGGMEAHQRRRPVMIQLAVLASTDSALMSTAVAVATDHIDSEDQFDGGDGRAATFLCSLATQCCTSLTKLVAAQDAEWAAALKVIVCAHTSWLVGVGGNEIASVSRHDPFRIGLRPLPVNRHRCQKAVQPCVQ